MSIPDQRAATDSYGYAALATIEVRLPTRRRRLIVLVAFSLLGGSMAYILPQTALSGTRTLWLLLLALVAGLSTLWSS